MNLKQLSEKLGLSQTTVSRALNGYPEVNEATRLRVKQAAAAGNYRPNVRAMSLAIGKAMTIGHVIPVANTHDVVNPIFAEFIAGASQTYDVNGYELSLTVAESKNEESIYRSIAAKRAVDGFIVHSPLRDDPRIKLLKEIGLPYVVHGRSCDSSEQYNWIDMNNRSAFKQATKLLIDLGHKNIALINGPETLSFAWLRRLGFEEALTESGLRHQSKLMCSDALTETYGYRAASQLLSLDERPTAFLVSSYIAALGIRRALAQAGLTIGQDVSVIIHDDELRYFDNGGHVPQFTSTRSSVREAGVIAAQMLLDIIDNPHMEPQTHLLQSHLIIGSSTGPCLKGKVS